MKLCVALDLPTRSENIALAEAMAGLGVWLKVGFRSYIRDGRALLSELHRVAPDASIFLDLKLYDIPNTMADAAEEIADLGVDMFNIHASAGRRGMEAVIERLASCASRPLVLAVTALTSFDEEGFCEVYAQPLTTTAIRFAKMAFEAGLDGVVCSVHESLAIKEATTLNFLTLTPGIRPEGSSADDQSRVATIRDALMAHVDFAVVGRPIYKADDPAVAAKAILTEMS